MKNRRKAVILQWYKSLDEMYHTASALAVSYEHGNETSVPTRSGEFLKYLGDKLTSHGRLVRGV